MATCPLIGPSARRGKFSGHHVARVKGMKRAQVRHPRTRERLARRKAKLKAKRRNQRARATA
jgi:hypothetical protein